MSIKKTRSQKQMGFKMRKTLNTKILSSTLSILFVVVVVCCSIMAISMQSLSNAILLDNLQPMARQSAKTVESNIHMLADRMMSIAADSRLLSEESVRQAVLEEAKEIYELHTIALYDRNGKMLLGDPEASKSLDPKFFSMLADTDNLTTDTSTIFRENLGILMGMPVKENGETIFYIAGVYKYDTLSDVLSNINVGRHGEAIIVNRDGEIVGYSDRTVVQQKTSLLDWMGDNTLLTQLTTGETGSAEVSSFGENLFLAYSPVRGTQWSLIIKMPKSDYAYLTNRAIILSAMIALGLLILAGMIIFRLSRSISVSVKHVANRMVELSDGNLHKPVEKTRTGDEIELLTDTLGNTVQSINGYISEIERVLNHIAAGNLDIAPQGEYKGDFSLIRDTLSHIINSMNETMTDFNQAAVRLSDVAARLNTQSSQLHIASEEQNESANHLVSEVLTVKDRLEIVTKNTEKTRDKTGEISQQIQEANTKMAALTGAMNNINEHATEITRIAKVIEDIAFQTNILSINASVEAARAGSAGKGFAVVADEVQNLAAKSAQAAKSTTSMISNTHTLVQTGVKLTADTAHALQSISESSKKIETITNDLAYAVQEQENALGAIEKKIETISAIADRNLQSAADTEESSGILAQEAEHLQGQVQKFSLKGRGKR